LDYFSAIHLQQFLSHRLDSEQYSSSDTISLVDPQRQVSQFPAGQLSPQVSPKAVERKVQSKSKSTSMIFEIILSACCLNNFI